MSEAVSWRERTGNGSGWSALGEEDGGMMICKVLPREDKRDNATARSASR